MSGEIVLSNPFDLWLASLTPQTKRAYRKDVQLFAQYIGIQPERFHTDTPPDVRVRASEWALSLAHLSSSSVARKVSAMRSFYAHLCSMHYFNANPFEHVRVPKVEQESAPCPNDEQVTAILASCNLSTFEGARDYAALLLIVELALRRSEVCNLSYGNLVKNDDQVLVLRFRGKGRKERELPVSEAFLQALERVRILSGTQAVSNDTPLLPNARRKKLSSDQLYAIVKLHSEQVHSTLSPHSLRHYAITDAAKVEENILKLMQFSGHSHPATVSRYIHFKQAKNISDIQQKRGIR